MRVAAIYDIHGNLPALEAVLTEIEREAPHVIVVGGDVVLGPMPQETLDRLLAPGGQTLFIRGNADREVVDHYDGTAPPCEPGSENELWSRRFQWVAQQITKSQRNFLAALPETAVLDIDGLGPTLFCHGSPRSDEEPITLLTPESRLEEVLTDTAEDVIVCGHTHVQFDRTHNGKRVVNAGSVGMHWEGRPGAYWLHMGPEFALRRTVYDLEDAARRIRATGYPNPDELFERLTANDPSLATKASASFEQTARDTYE